MVIRPYWEMFSREKRGNLQARERDRMREREDAAGRERTFKYEQKRARYFSPTLTVQTDWYLNLGGRQQFPSTISFSLRFPLERIVEQITEKLREERSGHEKFSVDVPETTVGLPAELKAGTKGKDTRRKSVWLCASENRKKKIPSARHREH